MPETPSRPDCWYSRCSTRRRRPCRAPAAVQHHAGIERAAARAHHQAVQRREAHGGVDAAARAACAHRLAPLPRCATTTRPAASAGRSRAGGRRCIRRTGRGSRSAARPRPIARGSASACATLRHRCGGRRCRSRRPAAGPGRAAVHGPDRREVVRLVQRRQRHQRLDAGQHVVVDPDGPCEPLAAMHHPVPDRVQPVAVLADPVEQHRQHRLVPRLARLRRVERHARPRPWPRPSATAVMSSDLAAQHRARAPVEQRELQAARSRVQRQHASAATASPGPPACPRHARGRRRCGRPACCASAARDAR